MRRRPRAPAGLLAAAGLALLLAPALPAAAQEAPGRGVQVDAFGSYSLLGGPVFQWPEKGFGGGALVRYKWPVGLSVGLGGRTGRLDVEIPRDGTLQDFSVTEGFAEATYSPLISGVVRPFLGVRLGFIDVTREVTLPPDAPVFGERPPWQAVGQEGSGFTYGAVAGSEFWVSDQVAIRVAGTGSRFSVSGFEALVDSAGRDAGSEVLGVEVGVSVFLGEEVDSDGDGVRDGRDRCSGTPPTVVVVDERGCALDGDGDGVADHRDDCPNTPRGVGVDEAGCAQDEDNDGVLDDRDQCAGTPGGAIVDAKGCAQDDDADGVPDGVDQCAGTAEGAPVDETGCVPDADADGVPDPSDACPRTREGGQADEKGCTRVQRGLSEGRVVLQGVTFGENSAQLTARGIDVISSVGQALVARPDLRVEIGVHTAEEGPAAKALSERRAEMVLRYLTDLYPELSADRFTTRGYGGSEPLVQGEGAEARAQNARVELVVTGTREQGNGGGGDGDGGSGEDGRRR